MFYNTKQSIERILEMLPEENSWVEYKRACVFDAKLKQNIKSTVVAFLNSIFQFGNKKYIIFGVSEDKINKKKCRKGLESYKFPDDNEWQNLFHGIRPMHPNIETGTLEYKGLLFGYILIYEDNYYVPYFFGKKETYYIRWCGSKYDDMTDKEKEILKEKRSQIEQNGKIYQKSNILNLLTTLGQYNESQKNDIGFIESKTGERYETIRSHCLYMDSSFSQNEKSIYGIGKSETVHVLNKHARLLQFSSDEAVYAIETIASVLENKDVIFSEDLLEGIVDTLVFLSDHGFSYYAKKAVESTVSIDMIQNHRFTNFVPRFAEISPEFLLKTFSNNKEEFLAREQTGNETVLNTLRVIAWFPEYYEEATKLLIEFNDRAIYELFECTDAATAAGFNQKLSLIKDIVDTNKELAFEILNKVLYFNPKMIRVLSSSYVPEKYRRLFEGVHSLEFEQLRIFYGILIETAGNDVEKIIELLPHWLIPSPFSDLQLLANHIERVEPTIKSVDDRQKLWNRLCNTPLVYITDAPVSDALRDRFLSIGNKFKPSDLNKQYQQWFRKDIIDALCVDNTKYCDVKKRVFDEQKNVLLKIYQNSGINGMVEFIKTVEIDPFNLKNIMLSEDFSLSIEDDNVLIGAFLDAPQIYSHYFESKSYREKLVWIKKLKIENLNSNERATFFASMYPTLENIKYFEEMLGKESNLYWLSFSYKHPDDPSVVQYVFENLIRYGASKTAFDLLEFLPTNVNIMEQLPPQWLYNALLSIGENQECTFPKYAFASIYRFLCGRLDDNMIEKLEILSFKLYKANLYFYEYEDFKPRVTFHRIVNEPRFFVDMVRDAMKNRLGLSESLLNSCDEKPKMLCDWLEGIDTLVSNESEAMKTNIDWCIGHILYNTLENVDGDYLIEDYVAELLEKSENKRQGFFDRAHFPKGFNSNGSYEEDSEDRNNAEKFQNMAKVQNRIGNTEFEKSLNIFAEKLIAGVECVL